MSALKPCPFCGETEDFETKTASGGGCVQCQSCAAEGPWMAYSNEAAGRWNKRSHGEWRNEPPDRPGLWISARDGSYIEGQFATVEDLRHPRPARLIRPGAKWIGPFEVENPFQ